MGIFPVLLKLLHATTSYSLLLMLNLTTSMPLTSQHSKRGVSSVYRKIIIASAVAITLILVTLLGCGITARRQLTESQDNAFVAMRKKLTTGVTKVIGIQDVVERMIPFEEEGA